MEEFLAFRKMVSPIIIQGMFIIASGLCIVFGIVIMWGGGIRILLGLLLIIFGPFMVRIWCESVILMFRINRNLTVIRRNTTPAQVQNSAGETDQ